MLSKLEKQSYLKVKKKKPKKPKKKKKKNKKPPPPKISVLFSFTHC